MADPVAEGVVQFQGRIARQHRVMTRVLEIGSPRKRSGMMTVETPENDPLAEGRYWYVLKVQSNRERSIRDNLLRRIRQEGLEEQFGEIVIPTEKVVETKSGKKRVTEHKLYPGYLMVQMVLNDDTWYLVRTTSGVGDFTGSAGKPVPMQDHEIQRMLGLQETKKEEAVLKVKMDFHPGDHVKIKEGPFESFEGSIEAIDEANGKITVLIQIFGRPTPVDLEYWQVERV
jgi:transcription termination/antitermination protein NusG